MSKSKKRMVRRLTLVTAVVALGVVAIIQSQRMARSADENKSQSPSNNNTKEKQQHTELPATEPLEATIVRGNNDEHEDFSSGGGFIPSAPQAFAPSDASPVDASGQGFAPPPADPQLFRSTVGSGRADVQDRDTFNDLPNLSAPPAQAPIDTQSDDLPTPLPSHATGGNVQAQAQAPPSLSPPADEFRVEDDLQTYQDVSQASPTDFNATPRRLPVETDASDAAIAPRDSFVPPQQEYSNDSYSPNQFNSEDVPPRHLPGAQIGSIGTASAASRASATPGPKHLEGPQTPSIALQKQAPPEIQVNKPATFLIKVQNVGQVTAEDVTVYDRVPDGTRFLDASPQAERTHDNALIWRLGSMKPGEEKTISMELLPQREGEIGSVARVSFESQASVRTICTRPQLELQLTAPPKVLIGQSIAVGIRISNPGTGAAEGVILEENVPDNFSHPAGGELEFEVGTLRPGESRTTTLTLHAEKAGIVNNVVNIRGAGNLARQEKVTIEVVAPNLDVNINGPTKRFLERRADYAVALSNPGTAPARNVEMIAFLHKGMKFIEANNQGQYDPQNHAVHWSLEELPAGQQGSVSLSVLPIETGNQRLRVESRADLGLSTVEAHDVNVDGLASLSFDVGDTADPIEVGSDTVYQVRVVNQGSKAATNVKVFAALPGGMKPIGADGPSGHQINGQSVIFDGIARLEPKAEAMFKIQARGVRDGRHQIRIQMVSDSANSATGQTAPVSKEESTLVYTDR